MVAEAGATFSIQFETVDKDTLKILRAIERAAKKTAKSVDDDFEKAGDQLSTFERRAKRAADAFQRNGRRLITSATDIRTAVLGVGAALAARRTVDLGLGLVEDASAAEETANRFRVVFDGIQDDADAFVNRISSTLGRSLTDVRNQLATFQNTLVPIGLGRADAAELSEVLTQLTIDLASFRDTSEFEALNRLQSGIAGNLEALRTFGVVITQNALNLELLNRGFEGGVQAASEQEKVLARVALILRATRDAQGDAIRTQDEFANRMRRFQSELRGVREELGAGLILEINDLIDELGGMDEAVKLVELGLIGAAEGFEAILRIAGATAEGFRDAIDDSDDLADSISRLSEGAAGLESLGRVSGGLAGEAADVGAPIADAFAAALAAGAQGFRDDFDIQSEELQEATKALIESLDRLSQTSDDSRLQRIALALLSNATNLDETRERLRRIVEQFRAMEEAATDASEAASGVTAPRAPVFVNDGEFDPFQPDVQAAADLFAQFQEQQRRFSQEQAALLKRVTQSFDEQRVAIEEWSESEQERLALLAEEGGLADRQAEQLSGLVQRIEAETLSRIDAREAAEAEAAAKQALERVNKENEDVYQGLFGAVESHTAALRAAEVDTALLGGITIEASRALDIFRREAGEAQEAAEKLRDGKIGPEELRQEIVEATAALENFERITGRAVEVPNLQRFFDGFSGGIETVGDGFEALGVSVGGAFDSFIADTARGRDAFDAFEESVIVSIAQIVARLAALRVASFASGLLGFGSPAKSAAKGGVISFAGGGILPTQSAPTTFPQSFQSGGVATSPTLALFGDQGGGFKGEAFVPIPADAKGIPVEFRGLDPRQMGDGGGGSPVNVTFQVQAVDAKSFLEQMSRRESRRFVEGVISDAMTRRTGFRNKVKGLGGRGGT